MTAAWAIRFDMRSESGDELASSLGRLRLLADVQTCRVDESNFWVSGPGLDDDVLSLLRSLLCEDRFRVDTDLTLTKLDERTPSGILPAGEWIPIRDFVGLELPVAGVSLPRIPRVPVALIRSSEPAEPRFLLVSSTDAAKWAASASQVRLDPLSFAVSDDGRFLFQGEPLPSVPGTPLVERDFVLVPAGWTWSPAIDSKSLRGALEAEANEFVLLTRNVEFEKIPQSEFVAASRSAIRVSAGQAPPDEG
jgi:hypothetical protein